MPHDFDVIASRAQLRLVESAIAGHAIYLLDSVGHVMSWNEGAVRLLGYTPDEAISESFSNFFAVEEKAQGIPEEILLKARLLGRFETKGLCMQKNGTSFFATITIDSITDNAGKIAGYAVLIKNLAEKIAAEKIKERLDQSQKMALIGELTNVVAHDFNNILAAISGSLELIFHNESQPLIDIAKRAANRGTKLTEQLQEFSRARDFCPQRANLNHLIKEFKLFLERAGKVPIFLNLNLSADLWPCDVDPVQFQSAILNLVWTCCDRMPNGGTITIESSNVSIGSIEAARMPAIAPGAYAAISVSGAPSGSAGAELPNSIVSTCLDGTPDCSSSPRLSQVYDFVQVSKGHLEIASHLGQDIIACLYLRKSLELKQHQVADVTNAVNPAPGTVLVVDDDPDVLEVTIMKLQRLGYAVNSAQDGHAALSILRGDQPLDILFTDVRMPNGMDGIDLARHARGLRPSLHIILASGDPRPQFEHFDTLQDKVSFLAKPYSLSLLAEKLATVNS